MKNNFIIRILSIVMALGCCVMAVAATASDITSRAIKRFNDSPSINAAFTVEAQGRVSSGTITVAGDRFRMDMDGMQVWYDGRTQWTYSAATDEVSVTEPSADELAQVNPFVIVSSLRDGFTATLGRSTATGSIVNYKPRAASVHGSLSVTYSNTTYWPESVTVDNGSDKVVIKVKSVTVGKTLHPSVFVYDKKLHPGAEIVDLR